MELPCLLSLVNAVSVKVSLGIQPVVGSHLLMQAKVLHTHRLGAEMVRYAKKSQLLSKVCILYFTMFPGGQVCNVPTTEKYRVLE